MKNVCNSLKTFLRAKTAAPQPSHLWLPLAISLFCRGGQHWTQFFPNWLVGTSVFNCFAPPYIIDACIKIQLHFSLNQEMVSPRQLIIQSCHLLVNSQPCCFSWQIIYEGTSIKVKLTIIFECLWHFMHCAKHFA